MYDSGGPSIVIYTVLFTLYTDDWHSSKTSINSIIKYSNDTGVIDLSCSDHVFDRVVSGFGRCCSSHFRDIHIIKTEQRFIEYRKNPSPPAVYPLKESV